MDGSGRYGLPADRPSHRDVVSHNKCISIHLDLQVANGIIRQFELLNVVEPRGRVKPSVGIYSYEIGGQCAINRNPILGLHAFPKHVFQPFAARRSRESGCGSRFVQSAGKQAGKQEEWQASNEQAHDDDFIARAMFVTVIRTVRWT